MSRNDKGNFDFFSGKWIFFLGVPSLKFLPVESERSAEIAFIGRSNVGKSSLINTLVGQNGLARTSNIPGRTQELNFFMPEEGYYNEAEINPLIILVDMPGYGFAKAPKRQVDKWTQLSFDYLRGRSTLRRVYLLIDSRRGFGKKDIDVLELLDRAAISYQIILTKVDKIKRSTVESLLIDTQQLIIRRPAAYPEIIATSSENMEGIKKLQSTIKNLFLSSDKSIENYYSANCIHTKRKIL